MVYLMYLQTCPHLKCVGWPRRRGRGSATCCTLICKCYFQLLTGGKRQKCKFTLLILVYCPLTATYRNICISRGAEVLGTIDWIGWLSAVVLEHTGCQLSEGRALHVYRRWKGRKAGNREGEWEHLNMKDVFQHTYITSANCVCVCSFAHRLIINSMCLQYKLASKDLLPQFPQPIFNTEIGFAFIHDTLMRIAVFAVCTWPRNLEFPDVQIEK